MKKLLLALSCALIITGVAASDDSWHADSLMVNDRDYTVGRLLELACTSLRPTESGIADFEIFPANSFYDLQGYEDAAPVWDGMAQRRSITSGEADQYYRDHLTRSAGGRLAIPQYIDLVWLMTRCGLPEEMPRA